MAALEEKDGSESRSVALLERLLTARDEQIKAQNEQISTLTAQIQNLSEQVAEFQRLLFGRRSEKMPSIESEVRRVVQADELTVEGEPMPKEEKARAHERRRVARKKSEATRKKKRSLRKGLPIVRERIEVKAEDLPEDRRIEQYREISCGEPIRRIEHVREHLVVIEYELQTLASKDGEELIKASVPPGVSKGCQYGPGLHAHVVVSKCDDSIPFHRLAKMLQRAGSTLARSTLCTMFHRSADTFVPVYERLFEVAQVDPYVHADETTLNVQAKGKCHKGWVWGVMSTQVLGYMYAETRGGEEANKLLGESTGYLTIDGYSGYNEVSENEGMRTRVGCWGHTRRKFFVALKNNALAREILEKITLLYRVEHDAAMEGVLGTARHADMRATRSAALVKEIEAWVDEQKGKHLPKSAFGRAVTYAVKQRARLRRFLKDPKLALDNNYAERALRIIALGRKNFLFAGSHQHAQNLAIMQTIVSTCRLHGVNPYEYIKDVLLRVRGRSKDEVDDLLPWKWAAAREVPAGSSGST